MDRRKYFDEIEKLKTQINNSFEFPLIFIVQGNQIKIIQLLPVLKYSATNECGLINYYRMVGEFYLNEELTMKKFKLEDSVVDEVREIALKLLFNSKYITKSEELYEKMLKYDLPINSYNYNLHERRW